MAFIGVRGRQDVDAVMRRWTMRDVRAYAKAVERLFEREHEAHERRKRQIGG